MYKDFAFGHFLRLSGDSDGFPWRCKTLMGAIGRRKSWYDGREYVDLKKRGLLSLLTLSETRHFPAEFPPHHKQVSLTAAYISSTESVPENSSRVAWNRDSLLQMNSQENSISSWMSGTESSTGAHGNG